MKPGTIGFLLEKKKKYLSLPATHALVELCNPFPIL